MRANLGPVKSEMRPGRVALLLCHEVDCSDPPAFVDAYVSEEVSSRMSQGHRPGDRGAAWIRRGGDASGCGWRWGAARSATGDGRCCSYLRRWGRPGQRGDVVGWKCGLDRGVVPADGGTAGRLGCRLRRMVERLVGSACLEVGWVGLALEGGGDDSARWRARRRRGRRRAGRRRGRQRRWIGRRSAAAARCREEWVDGFGRG